MTFVDYEKAFDSIELQPLRNSLSSQGLNKTYIKIIKYFYSNAKSVVWTEIDSEGLEEAMRGDTISPILFNIALNNEAINKIEWDDRGINIDGEYLSHFLYADDLILFSHSANELQSMLEDIIIESNKIGLTINTDKTKIMRNEFSENKNIIRTNNKKIEYTKNIIRGPNNNKRITYKSRSAFGRFKNICQKKRLSQKQRKGFLKKTFYLL